MITQDDIITLRFEFKTARSDIDQLIDSLCSSEPFKCHVDQDQLNCLQLTKLLHKIPSEPTAIEKLFRHIRKSDHYPYSRRRFMKELYYLQAFGLIKRYFDMTGTEHVKNISDNETIIYFTQNGGT